jgi:hypothetical protein
MKRLLLAVVLVIVVCFFISPGYLFAQEEFRGKLTNYFSGLLELTQFSDAPADMQKRIIQVRQKIGALSPDELVALSEALPQDSNWWDSPRNILVSFGAGTQSLQAKVASSSAPMRPIVPGVPPDCLPGVVEELFIAKGVVQLAEIAVLLTPGDTVVVVLGEGGTVAAHPARIIAVIALEIAKAAELVLDALNEVSTACNLANSQAIVHDFGEVMRVHLQVIELKTLGCSQGFWKNHTELWDSAIVSTGDLAPTYDPGTLFDDVFGLNSGKAAGLKDGATLLDALKARGGGTVSQARNAVTLLLNNDASNARIYLPCADTAIGDVGDFEPILGPFTRRFLLSSSEAGVPVDVSILQVHASVLDPSNLGFVDVTTNTTASMVKAGVLDVEIELPEIIKDARAFEITVLHDHGRKSIDDKALPISGTPTGVDIRHFGTILFHQEHLVNLGMGQ